MRDGLIAALDIGSSKVCCLIAVAENDAPPRVIGIGHQVSNGVRNGMIIDMDAATQAVVGAVHAAEQMAGETVDSVVVALTGAPPVSSVVEAEAAIAGEQITDHDVRHVLAQGRGMAAQDEHTLLHAIPLTYGIDGQFGIRDPRGMFAGSLSVQMHLVSAAMPAVRTLQTCVRRAHLGIDSPVAAGYAAGLACLVEDERDLGVTVLDMGAGRTSIGVFFDGALVFADTVPVGGGHVTNDIARGLSTPLSQAERMKTLYASALPAPADAQEVIDVPQVGENGRRDAQQVPRSILSTIVQPRLEETFELVRDRLEQNGLAKSAGRRVVLTGGASQLQGVRELAGLILDRQVRIGQPIGIAGLAESTGGPAFAQCAGLVLYAVRASREPSLQVVTKPKPAGLLGRVGHWVKESFS